MDKVSDPVAADSSPHSAAPPSGMALSTPTVATPASRLASKDWGSYAPAAEPYGAWFAKSLIGWVAFVVFLGVMSAVMLLIPRGLAALFGDAPDRHGLGESIGNIVSLVLVLVMVTATLLTMADRKWSALMQDRVGPNRARLPIPGLSDKPLKGLPHIVADVLKMLFKEDFIPERALQNKFLFNLGPLLAFAPAFCLFAVVPVGPDAEFLGKRIALQVAPGVDWGILYVFALASLAVFGTALAGWTSNNKLALLGGLRASAQLVSYEVTLGLTLVGAMIAFGTLRLGEMAALQGETLFGWLPGWGIIYQPIGCVLFLVAAIAETKRAPFDTPEGESEIIGYFLEYSGLKSGMFYIAEYAETVVVAGIITAIFLGGWHIPFIEGTLQRSLSTELLTILQVTGFIIKLLVVIWIQFLIRWSFPRFRYDQIMRLGWKMMLPISLVNVIVSAGIFLGWGRAGMAYMGIVEWIAIVAYLAFSVRPAETPAPAAHH